MACADVEMNMPPDVTDDPFERAEPDPPEEPISIRAVRYPLKSAVHTARYTYFERTGAIVRLCDDDDIVGYGEALPLPTWPDGDLGKVLSSLFEWRDKMRSAPTAKIVATDSPLPKHPVAAFAVDTARLSIAGQRTDRPAAEIIAQRSGTLQRIAVNALISAISPEDAAQEAQKAVRNGFQTVKLKVARDHISVDVARVAAVRNAVGDHVAIRLDANQGWAANEIEENLTRLSLFNIEYIEEPTASLSAMNKLRYTGSPIPIYLDEHLSSSRNAHQVIISDYADGLVLKPALLGPLSVTKQLADQANRQGMKVTVTNALDSGIGATAALHAAATIDGLTNACGFGTGELFAETVAPQPAVVDGSVRVSGPGFGIRANVSAEVLAPDLTDSGARQRSKLDRSRSKKRG